MKEKTIQANEGGKAKISDLSKNAHDLISMKKQVEKDKSEEKKKDLSNIFAGDSFEEIVFKMFEQMKAFNNMI